MRAYLKVFAALLGALATTLLAANTDNVLEAGEIAQAVVLALGAIAVYVTPNLPGARYAKTIVSAATAGFVLLAAAVTDTAGEGWDLTNNEKLGIAVAVLTTLGVFIVPNTPATTVDPGEVR